MAARGLPGAFITMDVHSGEILGLGSFPTFEPALFTRPLTQAQVEETYNNPAGPLTDRAISGYYPTGSTFKLITATAALGKRASRRPRARSTTAAPSPVGGETFKNAGEGAAYGVDHPGTGAGSVR